MTRRVCTLSGSCGTSTLSWPTRRYRNPRLETLDPGLGAVDPEPHVADQEASNPRLETLDPEPLSLNPSP
jgi:hypothetical protein